VVLIIMIDNYLVIMYIAQMLILKENQNQEQFVMDGTLVKLKEEWPFLKHWEFHIS